MRLHLLCHECFGKGSGQFTIDVTPNEDGIYEVQCPKNHHFTVDILLHRFQVLFENGIHSLADGYNMECFLSMIKCYERFLEFFVRVVSFTRGVDEKEFHKAWKAMSKQSERQLGAFIITYLREFTTSPKILSPNNPNEIQLRNKVIHQGYIPSQDDCIKFGDAVLSCIRPAIEKLKSNPDFDNQMYSSVNETGNFEIVEIGHRYFPYQSFAINRPIDKTEEKSMSDFLKQQIELKNRA